MHRTLRFSALFLLLLLGVAAPASAYPMDGAAAGSEAPETARYIIQLADQPLASYDGSIAGLSATAPSASRRTERHRSSEYDAPVDEAKGLVAALNGAARLDTQSPAAEAYANHLEWRQAEAEAAIQRISREAAVLYHYRVAYNGLTVRLTPDQAEQVARLPGVVAVVREEPVELRMDETNKVIHAVEAWDDVRIGGRAQAGKGVRIGIIDTGVAADHAMFDDTGYEAPPGFPRASVRIGDQVTDYTPQEAASFTNNKVIVSRAYANPELAASAGSVTPYPATSTHGTHVAGIAAGNPVLGGPNPHGTGEIDLSGVAPGAYLMAYRFELAYTPEILAAIDDAVADGADVLNNSWGTALQNINHPDAHPVSVAFKNATAANVVVVASAGNSGSLGSATLGGPHMMIDEVITVAASETGRSFSMELEASDDGLPEALETMPASYIDYGSESWLRLEGPAYKKKLCGDTDNSGAKDKIVFVDWSSTCNVPVVEVPENVSMFFRPFTQQMAGAKKAGAKALVFYSENPQGINAQEIYLFLIGQALLGDALPEEFKDLPVTAAAAGAEAGELAQWANGHESLQLILNITPRKAVNSNRVDRAGSFTSLGPAPEGLSLKPDITAPGVNVLSALASGGYGEQSGTSMSSPVVAGAVAVVRQAWPAWPPSDVKSALMVSADPVIKPAGGAGVTDATLQGAGRVNLARAIDPGLLASPPSINLGTRDGGEAGATVLLRDVRLDPSGTAEYAVSHEPGPGNGSVAPEFPASVSVPEGGSAELELSFDLEGVEAGTYDGRVVLQSDSHTVRITYFVRILLEKKDVLLVNARTAYRVEGNRVTFYDAPDYSQFWTQALDDLGLDYDVWTIAEGEQSEAPPYEQLLQYRMVIIAGGDGNVPLDILNNRSSTMTTIQMYLLGGGTMLASGSKWPHRPSGLADTQSSGSTHVLSRYFAGFALTDDDVTGVADLQPAWYLEKPVLVSDGSDPSTADNGGTIDLGKPLDEVDSRRRGQGEPAAPDSAHTHVAAEQLMPYIRSFLESSQGKSALTGLTNDATLENPEIGAAISWRAMYAGFPLEAVPADSADGHSRSELLGKVWDWAMEPDEVAIELAVPEVIEAGELFTVTASAQLPEGFSGIKSWRWDAGDGSEFVTDATDELGLSFDADGEYTVRTEITSHYGHTFVGSATVFVGDQPVPNLIYLPAIVRKYEY